MEKIRSVKGMRDIYGSDALLWSQLEACMSALVAQYGYQPIRLPLAESTALFCRSIGEATDIVEKEMYTFSDRGGDTLTLRPEGTAGCVRACIQHDLLQQHQRVFYSGAMFRRERPQKGRYRQFEQWGLEAFGMKGVDIEAEIMLIAHHLWHQLGLSDSVQLHINSLGRSESRQHYKADLVAYFSAEHAQLDQDSQKRLLTNPLRILDSKNPNMQALIANAPKLLDYLDESSREHFEAVCQRLDSLNIPYKVVPTLVRGLDYYNDTVFEWVTTELGAQGTLCAGGRYDGLVAQLGGGHCPAAGCAFGLDRVVEMMGEVSDITSGVDIYVVAQGQAPRDHAWSMIEQLRQNRPQLNVVLHAGAEDVFKKQFKQADKSGAQLALVVGDDEIVQKVVQVKELRESGDQATVNIDCLPEYLDNCLKRRQRW